MSLNEVEVTTLGQPPQGVIHYTSNWNAAIGCRLL